MEIHFAIGDCSLGYLLLARSDKGVCAISMGDDRDVLIQVLRDCFPNSRVIGENSESLFLIRRIADFIEIPSPRLDLSIDLSGTVFQRRVWQALQEIPLGMTMSYSQIASNVGSSARAVAAVCAANRIAIAIPCHRVIRKNGTLAGYRWGIERKRILLEREKRECV